MKYALKVKHFVYEEQIFVCIVIVTGIDWLSGVSKYSYELLLQNIFIAGDRAD